MTALSSRIVEVAELDFDFEPKPWPFAVERAGEIADHWVERKSAQPKLYDGRVLLLGTHELAKRSDGATVLRGSYFAASYSAFLAWRDFGFPDRQVCNAFSMAALRSSEGAFLLGEMSAHTANAGSIYFAAGTPDPQDVIAGKVDLTASVMRELLEETGIAPADVRVSPAWTVVYAPSRIACMKAMRIDMTAVETKARIEAFLGREIEPELVRMHIAASLADIDAARSPTFIADYLRHMFQSSVG